MEKLTKKLKDNIEGVKAVLSAEDILVYGFLTGDGTECAIVYTDGMVDKALLGDLAARPLSKLTPENKEKGFTPEEVKQTLLFPELKEETQLQNIFAEVLDGNSLLLVDGLETGLIVGAKLLPVRTVMEPPTDIAVKGPREGFIEDIKTNMALLRKRLKTPDLKFELQKAGKRSQTNIAICYLDGICDEKVKKEVAARIGEIDIDCIPDSSYVAAFIAPRKHSIFREVGTTEKPDILAAKMAEGRVGILVDGSPIALTVPFILTEDFQSSEDYFVSPFMATIFRAIRFLAILIALLLPAFYVTSQLFKMQLIPLGLMLNIASSVQGLPLSPSLEMFLVLLTLEVLKEASIRMPKYVGMALSIVGALVLGETAVSAGIVSTPTLMIMALSAISLYTVPELQGTLSLLRIIFLFIAGMIGIFGIILGGIFLMNYLFELEAYGTPYTAPYAPLIRDDLKDSIFKDELLDMQTRPESIRHRNRIRLKRQEVKPPKSNKR